jgi:hypothetical protein
MKKTYTPGPQMIDCMRVLSNVGEMRISKLAGKIGPHGSIKFGHEIITRCVKRGYVKDVGTHRFFRTMALTDKGREFLGL